MSTEKIKLMVRRLIRIPLGALFLLLIYSCLIAPAFVAIRLKLLPFSILHIENHNYPTFNEAFVDWDYAVAGLLIIIFVLIISYVLYVLGLIFELIIETIKAGISEEPEQFL